MDGQLAGLPLAGAPTDAALSAEVAALRAQLARMQLEQQQTEERHRQELSALLTETAAHEAAAVAEAAAAERTNCIYRFAASLQNTSLAPELLSHGGLAAASICGFKLAGGGSGDGGAAPPPFSLGGAGGGSSFLGLMGLGKAPSAPSASLPAAAALLLATSAGSGASLSPLSSSPPFCYSALEQRLRTEFAGDPLVRPAAEPGTLVPLQHAAPRLA